MTPEEWIVMCRVSGGPTGTREAVLKRNGVEARFQAEADARAEANRLIRSMNTPYSVADFEYWPERVR